MEITDSWFHDGQLKNPSQYLVTLHDKSVLSITQTAYMSTFMIGIHMWGAIEYG